jgi:hypothetical protein
MHAVVIKATIGDFEIAHKGLKEQVLPRVSNAPGLVAAYWTRSDDKTNGVSMIVFESEEAARAAAEMIGNSPPPETVTLDNVEVREVIANL